MCIRDSLLYISLESKRAPAHQQAKVRKWGIGIAIFLRIVLLFVLTNLIALFQEPVFGLQLVDTLEFEFNLHSIIVLLGGIFIIYTATKEILHMIAIEEHDNGDRHHRSAVTVVIWIVLMNLVFSFDSILSAIALTDNFTIMACAIVISGALMILLSLIHISEPTRPY